MTGIDARICAGTAMLVLALGAGCATPRKAAQPVIEKDVSRIVKLADGSQFDLNITYSPETSALETAGGIRKALPLLNPSDYFLVINGDVFSPNLPIEQLLEQVSSLRSMPNQPLAHLLMVPNPVQHPEGDFYLKDSKVANESLDGAEKLTFSGIGLYHRDLFKDVEWDVPTKLAPLLREAMSDNRVSGEKYTGPWHDVGTPQRLQEINAAYE